MTRGLSRASVLAIKEESTEGTLQAVASATDFIAIQPSPEITPNIESISNDEIRNSIGAAKPIQGLESPEASLSHYLRHSGVEGQAPNYGQLLECVFGSTSSQSTERTTTTGSTTTVVNLAAGGSDYARGKAILLKDGTNGYSIRPVHSVSTNALTLGFALANAPATGVTGGKFVNYSPANSSHPAMSLHLYNGNDHSYEAMAGGKVTEFSFGAAAGELINADYSLVGTKYFFNPITIAATDTKLDFSDGSTRVATVAAKVYRTPHELASALQTSMNAAGSSDTFTVSYSNSTGKFTLSTNGATLSLLWNTGTNTANTIGDKIGFSVAADDTGALTYTSDNAQSWAAPYTPSYDSADPNVAINNEVLIGDGSSAVSFCSNNIDFSFANENAQVKCISAETGVDANFFSSRAVTVSVTGVLEKHDVDFFNKYINNTELRFCFNLGVKSGGNWVAGKCASVYVPSCVISSFKTTDLDGVVGVEVELTGFVDSSGNGEVYVNFL